MEIHPIYKHLSFWQDSAAAMVRNMAPMLAKARSMSSFKIKMLTPAPEVNRANQQTELLKWQQEMFHHVLNTMCLVQDNLLDASELVKIREHITRTLIAVHPDGEWPEFTRDKLLFLQVGWASFEELAIGFKSLGSELLQCL
jgi:hypothetical protein